MIVELSSLTDERLDLYARLTEAQLRNKLEADRGIFIAESGKVIERALAAGCEPLSMLMEAKWIEPMAGILSAVETTWPETPFFVLPHEELEHLTGFEVTRGILAAFRRPKLPTVCELLANAHRVAVLEDITNPTNVGAIFRSAAALNIDAVLVTPGCYDPLYRRAVRVSMGTVFQVPWTRIGEDVTGSGVHGNVSRLGGWSKSGIPLLHDLGFSVLALALTDRSVSLDDPSLKALDLIAFVLGTEGEGLSDNTIEQADYTVRIPMAHNVDSLNVAAASAVAFWELRKRSVGQ